EVLAADGAELAHREEARDGDRAEDVADEPDVVVGLAEEARAATVAGEEEAPLHARRRALGALPLQEPAQVLVGARLVADVELDGLPHPDHVVDRDPPRLVGADHVADEEVAPLERLLVLVDHPADMEALLDALAVVGVEALVQLAEDLERR